MALSTYQLLLLDVFYGGSVVFINLTFVTIELKFYNFE
jgi:hypothetical protein